jgi:hypothetical protein
MYLLVRCMLSNVYIAYLVITPYISNSQASYLALYVEECKDVNIKYDLPSLNACKIAMEYLTRLCISPGRHC